MDFNRKNRDNDNKLLSVWEEDLLTLQIPSFRNVDGIKHFFTTRRGGVSEGIFESLNLSFNRGDKESNVNENYRRVAKALHCECGDIVTTIQTHTANIRKVTKQDSGKGIVKERDYEDIDGLVTNIPRVALAAFTADCVPVMFVDSKQKVIGVVHSGWRGTIQEISANMIRIMLEDYGCRQENILVGIGPSICQDCYEVSQDVADLFIEKFGRDVVRDGKVPGKYQLDLWLSIKISLMKAGVKESNITMTDICTCCNNQLLFSHRASHGKRGALGAFIMLKKEVN